MIFVLIGACTPSIDPEQREAILAAPGDSSLGDELFHQNCSRCHGMKGTGGSGPALAGVSRERTVEALLTGPSSMPAYYSRENLELAHIVAYQQSLE